MLSQVQWTDYPTAPLTPNRWKTFTITLFYFFIHEWTRFIKASCCSSCRIAIPFVRRLLHLWCWHNLERATEESFQNYPKSKGDKMFSAITYLFQSGKPRQAVFRLDQWGNNSCQEGRKWNSNLTVNFVKWSSGIQTAVRANLRLVGFSI